MTENQSPTLQARIDADLKQAMRDKDDTVKLTLRAVKTALTEARTADATHQLTQDEELAVLQREAKRRRDAAAEYVKFGEQGRADVELAELAVIERYLPRQLTEAEVEVIAQAAITQVGATSAKQLGAVMPVVMAEVKGRADGKMVNQVVRRLLGS